jgi:hypothetical protein
MALDPQQCAQAKIDWTQNVIGYRRQYTLTATAAIAEEGQLVVRAGTTALTVSPSTGPAATNIPVGVVLYGKIQASTFQAHETGTVPAAPGPYTVQLQESVMVANTETGVNDAIIYDITGATYLVVAGAAVAGTSVTLSNAGLVTFAAGDAGHSFRIVYGYTLTVPQARELFKQSPINRGSDDTFSRVTVAEGHCKIWTSMYDASGQWALHTQNGAGNSPCTGWGGRFSTIAITTAGTGAGFPIGRVIDLPGSNKPFLGIEYGPNVYVP